MSYTVNIVVAEMKWSIFFFQRASHARACVTFSRNGLFGFPPSACFTTRSENFAGFIFVDVVRSALVWVSLCLRCFAFHLPTWHFPTTTQQYTLTQVSPSHLTPWVVKFVHLNYLQHTQSANLVSKSGAKFWGPTCFVHLTQKKKIFKIVKWINKVFLSITCTRNLKKKFLRLSKFCFTVEMLLLCLSIWPKFCFLLRKYARLLWI